MMEFDGPAAGVEERERELSCACGVAYPFACPLPVARRFVRARSDCGVTVREVAVLAMLEDDAEWGCGSRGLGVGDWEGVDGVRGVRVCMRPLPCGLCGVAVCVDEEEAEESDVDGEGERDGDEAMGGSERAA